MSSAAEDAAPASPSSVSPGFKLRRIEIENFKALDKLELDLPAPLMEDDPDVFVIGSKNGIGKTSFLEACALLTIACFAPPLLDTFATSERYSLREYLIRAEAPALRVRGTFFLGTDNPFELVLPRNGAPTIHPRVDSSKGLLEAPPAHVETFFLAPLFGAAPEPLAFRPCLYFHSNRRVQHGPVEMDSARRMSGNTSFAWIKHKILGFLLAQAGLFENIRASAVDDTARILEELFRSFADAKLSKLRTLPNNALDIRVQPLGGGGSYSFDALSSGQKEMITTLFLIWHHTRDNPGLVLIDEPELHLNAEWQVKFIRLLFKLAPQNQYIFATHSEFIFRSVQEDRRILIDPQG